MNKPNLFYTPRTKLIHESTGVCDFDTEEFNQAVRAKIAREAPRRAAAAARRKQLLDDAREDGFCLGALAGGGLVGAIVAIGILVSKIVPLIGG